MGEISERMELRSRIFETTDHSICRMIRFPLSGAAREWRTPGQMKIISKQK
jgi:hypothetical protein